MRRRILATVVAVAALAVIAFLVPIALALRSTIRHSDLLELQREAAIVASRIEPADLVDVSALQRLIDPDHDLAFYDGSGHLVDGEGPATADAIAAVAVTGTFAEGYVGSDLVVAVPLRPSEAGPGLVVRIREPGAESEHRMLVRLVWLAAAAIGVIGVAGLVGWLLARRLSRPLENLRDRAGQLGRLADIGAPAATGIAEIDQLSAAMTDAATQIRELLRRERSFSSNVSHQLRTPVAALRIAMHLARMPLRCCKRAWRPWTGWARPSRASSRSHVTPIARRRWAMFVLSSRRPSPTGPPRTPTRTAPSLSRARRGT
jgi:signal transduction histidine kinase